MKKDKKIKLIVPAAALLSGTMICASVSAPVYADNTTYEDSTGSDVSLPLYEQDVQVKSVDFKLENLFSGEEQVITVEVAGGTQIDDVKVGVINYNNYQVTDIDLTKKEDGKFEGRHVFDENGKYCLYNIFVDNGGYITSFGEEVYPWDNDEALFYGDKADKLFKFTAPDFFVIKKTQNLIKSALFEDTDVSIGDETSLNVELYNNDYMLSQNIVLKNEEGYQISLNKESSFTIDSRFRPGTYSIDEIEVLTYEGLLCKYANDNGQSNAEDINEIKRNTLTVKDQDINPPVIGEINISEKEVSLKGAKEKTVTINADILHESEIDLVEISIRQPDGTIRTYDNKTLKLKDEHSWGLEEGLWIDGEELIQEMTFNHSFKNGNYEIVSIRVKDTLGFSAEKEFSETITLIDSHEDTEAPVVSSVTFSPEVVSPDAEVNITVSLSDISPIKDDEKYYPGDAYLVISDDRGKERTITLKKKDDNTFTGTIDVLHNWLNGEYKLNILRFKDEAGNIKVYESALDEDFKEECVSFEKTKNIPHLNSFKVENSIEDNSAPTLKSVTFNLPEGKTYVSPGDEVEVIVDADDSNGVGVKYVGFQIENKNENDSKSMDIEVFPDEEGVLRKTFIVPEDWEGTFGVFSDGFTIDVFDKLENHIKNYRDEDYEPFFTEDMGNTFEVRKNIDNVGKADPETPPETDLPDTPSGTKDPQNTSGTKDPQNTSGTKKPGTPSADGNGNKEAKHDPDSKTYMPGKVSLSNHHNNSTTGYLSGNPIPVKTTAPSTGKKNSSALWSVVSAGALASAGILLFRRIRKCKKQ